MVALVSALLLVATLAPDPFERGAALGRALRRASVDRRSAMAASGVAVALLGLGLAAHTAVAAAALTLGLSLAWRRAREDERRRRIRAALPSVAEGLAAAFRAGLPLPDALSAIAPGLPAPVAAALRRASAGVRLGLPLERSLLELELAFGPTFVLVRETLRAFHRTGGNAARSLERAAALVRAQAALQDEVRALTAQGRTSALVLSLLAPCGLLFSLIANPDALAAFLGDTRGATLLTAALTLEGVGALWLWRLVRR